MTVEPQDLRAAVAAGIVTEAQAVHLQALAHARRGARANLAEGDEPFELFRGFNEIFIVVGLVILTVGAVGAAGLFIDSRLGGVVTRTAQAAAVGAGLVWLLSEYFIRKRRMVAPAIALSVLFAGATAFGMTASFAQPFMIAQEDYSSLPLPIALSVAALGVFWLRFRVPFAMAMIALGLFVTAIVMAAAQSGTPETVTDLFLLSAGGPFAWITLALGLLVFAVAMVFDMSDPHRVTRRSANGFWLHVVAAPALVNTVALSLLEQGNGGSNLVLLAFLALIAVVAIVIDRRSFLIAAVGYCVVLATTVLDGDGGALTVLALGFVLLFLGAFWERIRAGMLRALPFVPRHRLPPSI